ncbi:hypothetical protein BLOT_013476 [Blomia tropicalis]|nr:hypothetical protein BLOT_013476 [Blomia tropicalis]
MLIPTIHLPFDDDVQLVDDDDYCHALLQMRLVNLWLVDDYMIKHTNSKFLIEINKHLNEIIKLNFVKSTIRTMADETQVLLTMENQKATICERITQLNNQIIDDKVKDKRNFILDYSVLCYLMMTFKNYFNLLPEPELLGDSDKAKWTKIEIEAERILDTLKKVNLNEENQSNMKHEHDHKPKNNKQPERSNKTDQEKPMYLNKDPIDLGIVEDPKNPEIFEAYKLKTIPTFNGDYLEFPEFWTHFADCVGKTNISVFEKYVYLKRKLSGSALKKIGECNDYVKACFKLINLYANPNLFISEAESRLKLIPSVLSIWDYNALLKVKTIISKIERGIRTIGINGLNIEFISKPILMEKLPDIFVLQSPYYHNRDATLTEMLDFMEKHEQFLLENYKSTHKKLQEREELWE